MCVSVHVRLCVCVQFIPCSSCRRINDIIINNNVLVIKHDLVKFRLTNNVFTLTFSVALGCADGRLTFPRSLLLFIKQRRVYVSLCVSQYNRSYENVKKSEIISASLRFAAANGKTHTTSVLLQQPQGSQL